MRHLIPISGKDSAATAIVQREIDSTLPYEYIFNETGCELPEMAAWLDKMEGYLGAPIKRIGGDLEQTIYEQGFLPSQQKRYCTRLVKIVPTEDEVKGQQARIYYGIRADEQRPGYTPMAGSKIEPMYPLQTLHLGIAEVWKLLEDRDLLPPAFFWQEVYDRVLELVPDRGWLDLLKPWQSRTLFAWRSRSNCDICFNQRIYEWVGLYRHHPDLFERAVRIEAENGADGFYFMNARSLPSIAARADAVTSQRVHAILKILGQVAQMRLFEDEEFDILNVTSCGLFCGK